MRRFLVIGGRVLLWSAVAVVLVRGVASIASSAHQARQQVVTASPVAAFPTDAATAFGARFAHDYLSYDAGNPDLRRRQMSSYLAEGADPMAGWDGKGSQSASAVVPVRVDVRSPDLAVVTVAGQVTGGRWQYLDVTVSSSGGELVVPEPPSLVAGPTTAGDAPDLAPSHVDASLSSSLRAPVEGRWYVDRLGLPPAPATKEAS